MTRPASETIFEQPWATRIGAALIVGYLIVAMSLLYDRAHRVSLESIQQSTSVGDHAFFAIPTAADGSAPALVSFKGQPLHIVSLRRIPLRDTKMIRQGTDDSGRYVVYDIAEPVDTSDSDASGRGFHFLKVADGEYLKVSPTPSETR